MELLNPSIEQLVTEIMAVNHAWKEAKDLFDCPNTLLANSLRDLKARLQVRIPIDSTEQRQTDNTLCVFAPVCDGDLSSSL